MENDKDLDDFFKDFDAYWVEKHRKRQAQEYQPLLPASEDIELVRDLRLLGVPTVPYPHQVEAIEWMLEKEECEDVQVLQLNSRHLKPDECNDLNYDHYLLAKAEGTVEHLLNPRGRTGGVLADDMGLGKTFEILALCVLSPHSPTLIVCPASLIDQWSQEISKHIGEESFTYHRQSNRNAKLTDAIEGGTHFILTTYGLVLSEREFLSTLHFQRVILDEAHIIRNRKSKTFQAVNELQTSRLWCLTGTPINLHTSDLAAYAELIGHQPFANFLGWSKKRAKEYRSRYIMAREKSILNLPPKTDHRSMLVMTPIERSWYKGAADTALKLYKAYLAAVGPSRSDIRQKVLKAIMKKQQIAVSPLLVNPAPIIKPMLQGAIVRSESIQAVQPAIPDNVMKFLTAYLLDLPIAFWLKEKNCAETCKLCLCPLKKSACSEVYRCEPCGIKSNRNICDVCEGIPYLYPCDHTICTECVVTADVRHCHLCELLKQEDVGNSTKIDAVLTAIHEASGKVVVFSNFHSVLLILKLKLLDEAVLYHGGLSLNARSSVLERFKEEGGKIRVLLAQIKAGGVGLNLTEANTVIIVDQWWNPMVERQATDRLHRIGQTKEVFVKCFTMHKTVEVRIDSIAKKRSQMADHVMRGTAIEKTDDNLMADLVAE